MTRDELWARACADAGFTADEAVWLELPGRPRGVNDSWAAVAGPGADLDRKVIPLDHEQSEWSDTNREKVPVFTYADVTDAAALGLMRWAAEYGRLDIHQNPALQLIRLTHVATQDRIRAAGAGGATYHHVAPEERQSQAAAGRIVRQMFGPQVGELRGPLGPLFREDAASHDDTVFGRRAVAFGAFHREDLEAYEARSGVSTSGFVAAVDPAAPRWWDALVGDDAFSRLSAAAGLLVPTAEETAAAGGTAREQWRTLVDVYERAERRALQILP